MNTNLYLCKFLSALGLFFSFAALSEEKAKAPAAPPTVANFSIKVNPLVEIAAGKGGEAKESAASTNLSEKNRPIYIINEVASKPGGYLLDQVTALVNFILASESGDPRHSGSYPQVIKKTFVGSNQRFDLGVTVASGNKPLKMTLVNQMVVNTEGKLGFSFSYDFVIGNSSIVGKFIDADGNEVRRALKKDEREEERRDWWLALLSTCLRECDAISDNSADADTDG